MPKFKKGSKAAKDYMASIRKMKGKPKAKKTTAKKVGAIKIVEKGETKLTRPTKIYQQTRTKSGTFKSLKRIAGTTKHKDTKSHNVNIRVVSGIQKTINGMQKTYMAIYQNKGGIINTAIFKASSLLEAKKYASAHKRHSPELKKYKSVSTSVKLYKN
ncbi:MAG: hypothetical protein K8R85_16100 [Bacteroidetes bacterium]|nr:hypothetical protein [Bacteroidota bacterium]